MRIYACYTESHYPLLERHFLPSASPEFGSNVVLRELPQRSNDGAFDSDGFQKTCLDKVDFILEALSSETEPFLYSDVDVRFYGPVVEDLTKGLGDADMAFQWDGMRGEECSGFMVIRPSANALKFWQGVRDLMIERGYLDQDALHHRLLVDIVKREKDGGNITWVILPACYWTFGRNDKHWKPGMPVNPPADLLVHHANWTTRIENKLALLEAVKAAHGNAQRSITGNCSSLDAAGRLSTTTVERVLPYSEVTRMLEQQREKLTAKNPHHPLPLALVLQFWHGDKRRALDLARLLADIEPEPRDDVLFVFARQANCPVDDEIHAAKSYVGQKFDVTDIEVEVDERKKYPGVCFDAFANAARKLSDAYHTGRLPYGNAFFFEADGCPIGSDWIDRLKRAHEETLLLGKRVTGPLIRYGGVDSSHQAGGHINGTLVMHLSCWEDHPSLHRCPPDVAWDVFHGLTLRMEAGPSQIIRNEHGATGLSESLYHVIGKESCWLTSCKDRLPQHWCRRYLEQMREKTLP